jgi:hypothetical protein
MAELTKASVRGTDVGEKASDKVDLIFVGNRQDNVGGFQTRLFQNPGIGARPQHDLHVQVIANAMESLGTDVDDHHFLFFLGQPFSEVVAYLTGANNDDFHRGNLVLSGYGFPRCRICAKHHNSKGRNFLWIK